MAASLLRESSQLRKYALPAVGLLHKNICRPFTRGEILSREFPVGRREPCHHSGVSVETDSQVCGLHRLMGQNTGFDDSEKARLVDHASIGVNDDPVVGEDSIERVRVIAGDRSREFAFQF